MNYSFKDPTPILFYSVPELMEKIVKRIEKERLRQNITQEELARKASISPATYRNFVYKKKISLENFIKVLKKLRMEDALRLIVDTPIEIEMAEVFKMLEEKRKKERKRARKK